MTDAHAGSHAATAEVAAPPWSSSQIPGAGWHPRTSSSKTDHCSHLAAHAHRRWWNHTFRGTGITAYLENGGTLEKARQMAAHASTRTTQFYDRREDRVTLDEVVKINIRG